jgi:hypothetical protein
VDCIGVEKPESRARETAEAPPEPKQKVSTSGPCAILSTLQDKNGSNSRNCLNLQMLALRVRLHSGNGRAHEIPYVTPNGLMHARFVVMQSR